MVRRWEEEEERRRRTSPHYRSEGRRQGSCGVFGGCFALSADLAKSSAFFISSTKPNATLICIVYSKEMWQ